LHLLAVCLAIGAAGCAAKATGIEGAPPATSSGCPAPTNPSPKLGDRFHVRAGETAELSGDGITLKFTRLLADSRCPTGVMCIWEGDAGIVINAGHAANAPADLELHTSSRFASKGSYRGFTVELLSVAPHPIAGQPVAFKDYCAEIRVTRGE
jgi:hypothetical protein